MNELQLGLIGLGAVAVAAVFAYNTWQERRHRQLVAKVLSREHDDVLLGAGRNAERMPPDPVTELPAAVAPVRGPAAFSGRIEPVVPDDRLEPVLSVPPEGVDEDETADASATPAARTAPEPPAVPPDEDEDHDSQEADRESGGEEDDACAGNDDALPHPSAAGGTMPQEVPVAPLRPAAVPAESSPDSIVSPLIDYVVRFELLEPVSGDQVLRSQRDLLARLAKPVGWAGCNDASGQWERVSEEGFYRQLHVGLLLADRRGPLGEAELITFQRAMQNLADELMAMADMPSREPALDAAVALDQFCANVDIQIGINVIGKGQTFLGTKIRALAEASGMVLDASGRFVRCDDDGRVLYTMANQESAGFSAESMKTMSTHGLVFLLDVPRVDHGDRVFAQMLDLARRMADALNGALVDDHRRPLTEAMLDPFRRQIGQFQGQLAAKGLPAGGPLALRLFS